MTQRAREETDHNSQTGQDTPPRQEDTTPPEQVSDPHVQGDESSPSIGERISKNKARLIGYSFAVMAALFFLGYVLIVVVPGLLTNPVVLGGLALLAFTTVVFTFGGKRWLGLLRKHTLLLEVRPRGLKLWITDFDRSARRAKHYRGISLFRGTRGHYLVEDLADSHQLHVEKYGGDAEDPATIQYPPSIRVADTWMGTVAGVVTSEYKVVGGRSDIHFIAQAPRSGHQEDIKDLAKELEERDEKIGELLDDKQDLKEARDEWRAKYKSKYQTIRKQVREDIQLGQQTARPRRRQSRRGDRRPNETADDLTPFMNSESGDQS